MRTLAVWASVWVSRSRSSAARVSGWVWAELPRLRRDRDGEAGGLPATEADVDVNAVGLVQGDVVDEEADRAFAFPLRSIRV